MNQTCIFCEILAGRAEASMVYRDAEVSAFMDIQPVNPGHVLVVPNAHAADLAALDPSSGRRIFEVAQQISAAIYRSDLRSEGINLFLADGEAAGQDVFHIHLHVVPRFEGDGFGLKFGPNYANLPTRQELDRAAGNLRARLGA
ncbi:MAG TPA: HIT family protein [Anaerolineales bacterium]|jgi:histidine triad (HIT) family protein|nr:HIT family protein [Anaerolineales bacterium]